MQPLEYAKPSLYFFFPSEAFYQICFDLFQENLSEAVLSPEVSLAYVLSTREHRAALDPQKQRKTYQSFCILLA